jgi:hypothetical protein
MKRKWITATVAAAILAAGCGGSAHSTPKLSAACKHEVAVQNAFVHRELALGYPNVPLQQGVTAINSEVALLKKMQKVCPPTMKIHTLPRS